LENGVDTILKILLANYRYFISGGPERYMFNVKDMLTSHGHEVVPFSVRYSRNQPSPYSRYFVDPLAGEDQVLFREQDWSLRTVSKTLSRLFYAQDVERAGLRLINDTRPDIAYVLHYLRKLSPSLLVALKKSDLPIVVRLSDYAMLCPGAHCLRNESACEQCIGGSLLPSIRYGCIQHSRVASLLNALATWYHRFRHYFDLIDAFVTTNSFMYQMMLSAGFQKARLHCIPTFVQASAFIPHQHSGGDTHIAYIGRIEPIKGVHVLIDALTLLKRNRPELRFCAKLAGTGHEGYVRSLKEAVFRAGLQNNVQFVGELTPSQISTFLEDAFVSVIPSTCYENLPNALLESYASGVPVLASKSGSLAFDVRQSETGFLFEPGDSQGLADLLSYCLENPNHVMSMASNARKLAEDEYSPQRHTTLLEALFTELIHQRGRMRGSPELLI
jgi:glycosyltransferase involved in cell wall biosynthesis